MQNPNDTVPFIVQTAVWLGKVIGMEEDVSLRKSVERLTSCL